MMIYSNPEGKNTPNGTFKQPPIGRSNLIEGQLCHCLPQMRSEPTVPFIINDRKIARVCHFPSQEAFMTCEATTINFSEVV